LGHSGGALEAGSSFDTIARRLKLREGMRDATIRSRRLLEASDLPNDPPTVISNPRRVHSGRDILIAVKPEPQEDQLVARGRPWRIPAHYRLRLGRQALGAGHLDVQMTLAARRDPAAEA
jgi:hypothetical protein